MIMKAKYLNLICLSVFILLSCNNGESKSTNSYLYVKKSKLAGSWYPEEKEALLKTLKDNLKKAESEKDKYRDLYGIISPHAGYYFSGATAAYGFKLLDKNKIKRVVIMAPSHYSSFRGFSTAPYSHYETPLGRVEIDKKSVNKLKSHNLHVDDAKAHEPEHSIEIEIPFLQAVLDDFKIIPILVGELSQKDIDSMVPGLKKLIDEKTVFVISSDFTHYGPRFAYSPFNFKNKPDGDDILTAVKKLDDGAIEKVTNLDCPGFREYVNKTKATICGKNPIALFLRIIENLPSSSAKLLNYANSGKITSDYSNTVSYASIVFYRDKNKGAKRKEKAMEEYILTNDEKNTLLKISRDTLKNFLKDEKYPEKNKYKLTDNLNAKRGVFVTLHKKGALRGCIGYIEGIKPVYQAVMENTVNAALEDPRFPRVKNSEIDELDIEISVMTPLKTFKKAQEIEIGRDGLVISKGFHRGLLLPQVATEWKWDRIQFLEAVSNKAGLPKDSWKKPDVKLEKFSAIVFGEKKNGQK